MGLKSLNSRNHKFPFAIWYLIYVVLTHHFATIIYSLGRPINTRIVSPYYPINAKPAKAFFDVNPKVTNSVLCFTKGDRFGVMWQSRRVLDCHNLAESLACLATCWPKKNGGRNIQRRRNYRTCGKIGHERRLVAELVTKRRLSLTSLR